MAQVRNLSKEVITTITAGNIKPGDSKRVADWEVKILSAMHGNKISVLQETPRAKGKK